MKKFIISLFFLFSFILLFSLIKIGITQQYAGGICGDSTVGGSCVPNNICTANCTQGCFPGLGCATGTSCCNPKNPSGGGGGGPGGCPIGQTNPHLECSGSTLTQHYTCGTDQKGPCQQPSGNQCGSCAGNSCSNSSAFCEEFDSCSNTTPVVGVYRCSSSSWKWEWTYNQTGSGGSCFNTCCSTGTASCQNSNTGSRSSGPPIVGGGKSNFVCDISPNGFHYDEKDSQGNIQRKSGYCAEWQSCDVNTLDANGNTCKNNQCTLNTGAFGHCEGITSACQGGNTDNTSCSLSHNLFSLGNKCCPGLVSGGISSSGDITVDLHNDTLVDSNYTCDPSIQQRITGLGINLHNGYKFDRTHANGGVEHLTDYCKDFEDCQPGVHDKVPCAPRKCNYNNLGDGYCQPGNLNSQYTCPDGQRSHQPNINVFYCGSYTNLCCPTASISYMNNSRVKHSLLASKVLGAKITTVKATLIALSAPLAFSPVSNNVLGLQTTNMTDTLTYDPKTNLYATP